MSDTSQGPGWWLATDGKWYPPAVPVQPRPTWADAADPNADALPSTPFPVAPPAPTPQSYRQQPGYAQPYPQQRPYREPYPQQPPYGQAASYGQPYMPPQPVYVTQQTAVAVNVGGNRHGLLWWLVFGWWAWMFGYGWLWGRRGSKTKAVNMNFKR